MVAVPLGPHADGQHRRLGADRAGPAHRDKVWLLRSPAADQYGRLLGCMVGLNSRTLLDGNSMFVEFKGALTEQYVCQQLKTVEDLNLHYYTNDRGGCEVDFVADTGEEVIPIEVKAEVNLRARSLKTYCEKYSPRIAVRTSMTDYKKEEWLTNLPLYAISWLPRLANT